MEIKIPIKAPINNLFACFIFSGLPLAVISLNHHTTSTAIHTTQILNRRYWLMTWMSWKKEDSSP
jgi:hypothetical protein